MSEEFTGLKVGGNLSGQTGAAAAALSGRLLVNVAPPALVILPRAFVEGIEWHWTRCLACGARREEGDERHNISCPIAAALGRQTR